MRSKRWEVGYRIYQLRSCSFDDLTSALLKSNLAFCRSALELHDRCDGGCHLCLPWTWRPGWSWAGPRRGTWGAMVICLSWSLRCLRSTAGRRSPVCPGWASGMRLGEESECQSAHLGPLALGSSFYSLWEPCKYYLWKSTKLESDICVLFLNMLLTCCVTSGGYLNLSEPQFPWG